MFQDINFYAQVQNAPGLGRQRLRTFFSLVSLYFPSTNEGNCNFVFFVNFITVNIVY